MLRFRTLRTLSLLPTATSAASSSSPSTPWTPKHLPTDTTPPPTPTSTPTTSWDAEACELPVFSLSTGSVVDVVSLSPDVFGGPVRVDLMHRVVRWQRAKARSGVARTLSRGEVRGSNRKAFKQKGSGRARRGPVRKAPHIRGGGVAFGKQIRDFGFDLDKKVRSAGLRSALANRVANSALFVVDSVDIGSHKTKDALAALSALGVESALVIDPAFQRVWDGEVVNPVSDFELAARNLHKVSVLPPLGLNVYDILKHDALILSLPAVADVEARLLPKPLQRGYKHAHILDQ